MAYAEVLDQNTYIDLIVCLLYLSILTFYRCWLFHLQHRKLLLTTKYVILPLQDKKTLTLGPDDHLHLEGFALNVFAKADKQDRAGRADMYHLRKILIMLWYHLFTESP
jgi:hypothetical protein